MSGDTANAPGDTVAAKDATGGGHPNRCASPSRVRGLAVLALVAGSIWWLSTRGQSGEDEFVQTLGRIEVTARLVERPHEFPSLGAYRYTYVLRYKVLKVQRADPGGRYVLKPGDEIFVGHYKPWLSRTEIKDRDWGDRPLGGRLDVFVAGAAHRLALDYELADLAPSGALDYCFPPATNRFFALWTNPTTY
jgi:hypothetical protein